MNALINARTVPHERNLKIRPSRGLPLLTSLAFSQTTILSHDDTRRAGYEGYSEVGLD